MIARYNTLDSYSERPRFFVSQVDDSAEIMADMLHELPIPDTPAPDPLRDGPFNVVSYTFPIWGYGFDETAIDYSVQELADLTGRVQINPVFQQETISSSTFLPPGVNPYPDKPNMTPSMEEIQFLVDKFVAADVEIDFKFGANVADDTWSGLIDPADPDEWFAAYTDLILPWADVAEEIGSDSILLTNEAMTLTGKYRDHWVALIEDVREVYSGRIGVNSTVGAVNSLSFADQLDFIGLSLYVPTTDKLDPTVEELVAGWSNDVNGTDWLAFIEDIHETYDLPVQITELAFWGYDGAAANSNYFGGDRSTVDVDLQEQQDQYEAFFQVFSNLPERWFEGVTFWRWRDTTPDSPFAQSVFGQTGAFIDGKPAEETVRDWLSGARQTDGIFRVAVDPNGEILDGGYNHDTLVGGEGPDTLFGGRGDDHLVGFGGSDVIYGQDGDDNIHGLLGSNRFSGGVGDDVLFGAAGADILDGGAGTDFLQGYGGEDTILGGTGLDILIGETRGIYHTEISAQVFRMYSAVFGREPDLEGHQVWARQLISWAVTLDEMAGAFVASPEFQQTYGDANDTHFITLLYINLLDRSPEADGLAGWMANLNGGMSRAEVVRRFAESPEHVIGTADDQQAFDAAHEATEWADDVYRLFRAVFDRDPDEVGFTGWVENLSRGDDSWIGRFTVDMVIRAFMGSPEFQATYGSTDNTQFVTLLYNNVLDRDPDAGGLTDWIDNLDGGMSREEVVKRFMSSPEFIIGTEADLRAFIDSFGADDVIDPGPGDAVVSGGLFADTFVFTDDVIASTVTVTDFEVWDTLQFFDFGLTPAQILGQMTQQGNDVVFADGLETIVFANTALGDFDQSMITIA